MDDTSDILHELDGKFFSALIKADKKRRSHWVAIRVQDRFRVAFETGGKCDAKPFIEIVQLTKTAIAMACFLNDGGHVEEWHDRGPAANAFPNERQN